MRKPYLLAVFIVGLLQVISAQSLERSAVKERQGSYPIAGSHLLQKDDAMVRAYFRAHPEALRQGTLRKSSTWGFSVGSTHSWKSVNTSTNAFFTVPSTCRAVGTNCYVFVEDASWGSKVTQAEVDSVTKAFDASTPANASKGIFQTDVDTFGNPPDIDGDPKIIILILDIQDGYNGSGGYVAGYFHSINELPTGTYANSNQAEIYYLDCNPLQLTTHNGLVDGMSTTAHEFQHMIHFNYDDSEISFVNEGCSLVAEVVAGYSLYDQSGFTGEPNHYLLDWRYNDNTNVLKDYSRAARFSVYLHDQFGAGFFKPLVQSAQHGVAGYNSAFQTIGTPLRFTDVVKNWSVANAVNNSSVDASYGYSYPGISTITGTQFYNPNVPASARTVQGYSADYFSFVAGSNLTVTFTLPASSPLLIKAVTTGTGGMQVADVDPSAPYHLSEFGNTIDKVTFIVMNASVSTSSGYTMQSSGTSESVEMKYDLAEPTGYLGNASGDTVSVRFDGVPDARLDSVRVAIRRAGTMTGGVWKYSGNPGASPLGEPIATNLSATVTGTPGVPYPVPWNNWATIDLTSLNISAASPFAVAFACAGAYASNPRVMTTESPIPDKITSLTYSTTDGGWFYYVSNNAGDSVFTYLIRAYASFVNPNGIKENVELLPAEFSLSQNYPNPFNPNTVINYQLPKNSFVTLKVYDGIGREVATLVNGMQEAGGHTTSFNASHLPSGLYYYTLQTNNFSDTKKMLLVK